MTKLVPHIHAWDVEGHCIVCGAREMTKDNAEGTPTASAPSPAPTPRTDALDDERAPDTNGHDGWKMAYFAMLTLSRQLERELAQARRDAERYRWVRTFHRSRKVLVVQPNDELGDAVLFEDQIDAAIDEAMAAEKAKEER